MKRWLIWGVYAALWTTFLVLPGSGYASTGINEWPYTVKTVVTKTLHVSAYAGFAVLSGWLPVRARRRWMLLFFIMAHGTITELIQLHFRSLGRTGCLEDVGLNNAGVLLGILASWKWWTAD